jgi:hypothetical protein
MRRWQATLATLMLWALSAGATSAQTPPTCSVLPQSVCEDAELIALEGERSALIEQLSGLDPQNPALAGEQTWIDALGACGDDVACYRTAYLNHNETLRQSVSALPGATEPEPEAPPDAAPVEDQPAARDAVRERERAARDNASGQSAYVAGGLPGWGFFTAIGVTLLIFYLLLRALGKNRRELRAEEARLRRR